MEVFGDTRSRLTSHYALITPDTHVESPLVGWKNSKSVIHISPVMGARFSQYTAFLEADAESYSPGLSVQRFLYVQNGSCKLFIDAGRTNESLKQPHGSIEQHELSPGGYAYIPADMGHLIRCEASTTLVVFEKRFQFHPDFGPLDPVVGNANNVVGEPFQGDEDARLQTLLPILPGFDMAVNIFTYQPGATLPQVEIHVMEHGLLMLDGQGVYRLGTDYFPVAKGDVIWMASYCPQWFVAMGKTPASYIYYKDIHRDRLSES
jgi:(S)-ureidoglycine aminohydrolase